MQLQLQRRRRVILQRCIGCPCFRSRQRAACARAVKTALAAVCALGSSASSACKCCGRDAHDVMGLAAAGHVEVRVGVIVWERASRGMACCMFQPFVYNNTKD